jgi:hypothetical protein
MIAVLVLACFMLSYALYWSLRRAAAARVLFHGRKA